MLIRTSLTGGVEGVVISIGDIESGSYGSMCSAWVVRGAAPLPDYYAYGTEGVLLTTSFSGLETVFGEAVPPTVANKTLFNTLYAAASLNSQEISLNLTNRLKSSFSAALQC